MSSSLLIKEKAGWFSESGAHEDVVISSRIRLSRNLNGHMYPGKMEQDEEDKVGAEISDSFGKISGATIFRTDEVGNINPLDRKILLERNHISQDFTLHQSRKFALSEDNLSSCMINERDHIRLSVFGGGLDVEECYKKADAIDRELEKYLDYAVSFDLGYLNTEVGNLGTGMKVSVMMHLPALVKTNLIEKALKAVVQIGFTVKGFMGDEDHSLGSMYQISNQFTIGHSEQELIEKLENLAQQISLYERKAREELFEKKRTELEDTVYRAYGLLTNCRLLGSNEAMQNLSMLRLGAALGMFELPMNVCSTLIFLSQKSHIQRMLGKDEDASNDSLIDFTRAELIKKVILEKQL